MRGGLVVTALAGLLAAGLAGCLALAGDGPAWSVEAPRWEAGFAWDWTASDANGSYPGHLEVVARDRRLGLDGFLLWDRGTLAPYPHLSFTTPERMGLMTLHGSGTMQDICTDWSSYSSLYEEGHPFEDAQGPLAFPLLPFPLEEGMDLDVELDPVLGAMGIHWIQNVQVAGRGDVTTPAGTFDAVRVELRSWWASDDPEGERAHRLLGQDAASRRAGPPAAVLHYAPEARHVVRMEGSFLAPYERVPGTRTTFLHPSAGFDPPQGVIELQSLSLEPGAELADGDLAAKANDPGFGPGWCADPASTLPADPRPPPSVSFTPRETTLEAPGSEVTWSLSLPTAGADYRWTVRDAAGNLTGAGAGTSFTHRFDAPGAFKVEVEGERDGQRAAQEGYTVVEWSTSGTLECDAVVADGLATTFPDLVPVQPPTSCEPLAFDVPPGITVVDAIVRHGPEGRVPCSHLSLLDPSGTVRSDVFTAGSEAHLEDLVHTAPDGSGDGRGDAGTWTLEWHPGAQALAPTYELRLSFIPDGYGFSWSGGGSPGC